MKFILDIYLIYLSVIGTTNVLLLEYDDTIIIIIIIM